MKVWVAEEIKWNGGADVLGLFASGEVAKVFVDEWVGKACKVYGVMVSDAYGGWAVGQAGYPRLHLERVREWGFWLPAEYRITEWEVQGVPRV